MFGKGKFSPHRKAKNRGKTKGLRGQGSVYKGSGISHSRRYGRSKLKA